MKIKTSTKNAIIAGFWAFLTTIIVYFFGMYLTTFIENPIKAIGFVDYLCGITFLATFLMNLEKKTSLMSKYNDSLELLYKHVGFIPDWVVYPIDDCTDMFWSTDEKAVKFSETMEKFNSGGEYYEDPIYTQRFYKKHIYRGKDYTMIFCDSRVDGMRYFRIFDNKKEQNHEREDF